MIDINREHPEYEAWKNTWPRYRDLYAGGEQFTSRAEHFLIPRVKEPPAVFAERIQRAFYENYIGSIIDWYAGTLFRREPILTYEGADERARQFFNMFAEDCDLRGSTLSDFFRRQVIEALVAGRSYVVIDFPRSECRAETKAEEDELGVSRGYLWDSPAPGVINWQRDRQGDFDWVVLRSERKVCDRPSSEKAHLEREWTFYDRRRFEIYRQVVADGRAGDPALVAEGQHGLADLNVTPVFEFTLGDGMWLMNRAASLQLEHFNKSNALAWALTNGLFAMPVIYSDREYKQLMGESYYLTMGKDDRFGWTEPQGHIFDIAMRNLDRLKEEIYRVCYLTHQAGGSLSKNSDLTGLSKQRDYLVTQEVLRSFGDRVKDTLKRVLCAMAHARRDEIEIGVSGMDEFDIGDFSNELDDARKVLSLGTGSKTLEKQIHKKLAFKFLCDASQEVKDRIAREIDGLA